MVFKDRLMEKLVTSEKEQNEEISKKLNPYANDLMKEPLKLEISNEGFPLCPICREEFKDEETIINHLKRNKKEFKELTKYFKLIQKNGKKEWILTKNLTLINWSDKLIEPRNIEDIKEDIKSSIRKIKVYNKIKEEKYKEWKGEIKKKKPREHPISPRLRFKVLQRDNFTCQYCGKKAPEIILEVDHIEPYSKTQNNDIDNLITSCKECNRGKKTKEVI